ncbi:hypothetical protein HFD88_000753 [Aspergillus terreus]|nr:hypothetical protein HFD88_000753 [Aspergillus terreus]
MHPQAVSEPVQAHAGQPGQFPHDARASMAPLFNALNLQNQRAGRKFGNIDIAGAQRAQFQSPMMIPPVFLPMSTFPPTSVPAPEQVNQMPFLPTSIYQNPALCTAPLPGYPMPYLLNNNEEQEHVGHQGHESGSQTEFFNPGLPNYLNTLAQLGPALPFQMMKTPTGYMLQDLESITQQEPPIPRAVPAMWTNPSEVTLAKCLENREGITNVYIRGFLPETTDEMLHSYASRFGKIDRCKAIVDLDTGLCKGFGFVQYFNFEACCEYLRIDGYRRDIDRIYAQDLRRHFEPYRVVSEKISRDEKTGVSKEVGFARFETREIAEKVLAEFHNVVGKDGVKLLLRFADTKAQKMLKQQSNERRAYRAGEYNYSVEVVQGSSPSPSLSRLQQTASHLSPNSQNSYVSPVAVGPTWTPATSISPPYQTLVKNQFGSMRFNSWTAKNSPGTLDNTPLCRGRFSSHRNGWTDNIAGTNSKLVIPGIPSGERRPGPTTSPRKENLKAESLSPVSSRKEIFMHSPRSAM